MNPSRLTTPVGATLLALLYVVSGLLGHSSSFMNGEVALIWPPSGIALAAILLSCLLGTTVNATFNVIGLCYSGRLPWEQLFENVIVWWVPNAMAALVVTPIILAWSSPCSVRLSTRGWIEAVCCAIGLIVGTQLSFNSWFVYDVKNYPLAFLPYPFLVWAALRFGQRGGTTGTFVVASLAITELLHHHGPFWVGTDKTSLLLIGCYIGVMAVGNLLLA